MTKSNKKKAAVFLNGRLLGHHDDGKKLVLEIRQKRREGILNNQVNVYYDPVYNEVYVNTDTGRVRRPYIIVEKGKSKLTSILKESIKRPDFEWRRLIAMGVVEYLDAEEEESAKVATYEDEITEETTHLEINPSSIVSITTGVLPYVEHNSSPRITMACSMAKQSLGTFALNFNYRYDSRDYIMYYPQKPIGRTIAYRTLNFEEHSAGQNAVVAIMSYKGYNLADALIVNKSSVDRGFGRAVYFKTYETEERKYPGGQRDKFEIPSPNTVGYRGEFVYRHLNEDGIIRPETLVNGKDVLVGKTSPPRFLEEISVFGISNEKKRENSLSLKAGSKGIVDSVMLLQSASNNNLVKIRIRNIKIPEIGDKMASRHGQKGVIGMLVPQEDMPFTKDGIVPDIIINPHAIPSRMTAGHLIEMLGGKATCFNKEKDYVDTTAFTGDKAEQFMKILKENGFDEYGEEYLYDGITGERIKSKIFIGVIYYQRLHHMVSNKMHMRSRGPVQLLTRQPTEGRSREGGLRLGEMERDCLVGYGASMVIKERLLDQSDKTIELVCPECGSIAIHDHIKNRNICPVCKNQNVVPVEMSYAFKLLIDEIKSLCIFPRLILKDKT